MKSSTPTSAPTKETSKTKADVGEHERKTEVDEQNVIERPVFRLGSDFLELGEEVDEGWMAEVVF